MGYISALTYHLLLLLLITGEPCKDELTDRCAVWKQTRVGLINHVLVGGPRWRHLANTTE